MNYKIRKIEIPLEVGKVIEFSAKPLCKIIECAYDYWNDKLYVVVMERWGQLVPENLKVHKLVILEESTKFELTLPYEPVLSRRGKFSVPFNESEREYYVFQL